MPLSKPQRLREFLRRLSEAPPAQSYEEARQQVEAVLNAVEDDLTDIPFSLDASQSDGRMYPPLDDNEKKAGHPGFRRFRTKAHNLLYGTNGAVRIHGLPLPGEGWTAGVVILDKAGLDGRRIQDL
jgi:hypothetical protein